jgi:histidinol-phosphate aminotransferase
MTRRAALVIAERERVLATVRQFVADVPESQANFVWLPLRDASATFAAALESEGVIVRPFQGDGVRVTIGTVDENDAFLAAAQKALSR